MWPIELVGGLAFVVVVVIIGILVSQHSGQPTGNTASTVKVSPTPDSYNDYIGTVTAVDAGGVSVAFQGTAASGRAFTKLFQVIVDKTTEVKKILTVNNQRVLSPIALTDISIGSTVFIAADKNIAPLTEFTATKLYLY